MTRYVQLARTLASNISKSVSKAFKGLAQSIQRPALVASLVLSPVMVSSGCTYPDYDDHIKPVIEASEDLDGNKVPDVQQGVLVAPGEKNSGMCYMLHKPVQAYDPSCTDMGAFGYGGGAYEDGTDDTTNWEDSFLAIVPVTLNGNQWCGAQFRPGNYRIGTGANWSELYQQDGWSHHELGSSAAAGDFRWVVTRSEGSEDCYHEVTNIAFGCDTTGHPYEVDAASLGERDSNCGG